MKDSEILSGYAEPAAGQPRRTLGPRGQAQPPDRRIAPPSQVLVFDACHSGLVLRALAGVFAVLVVASGFASPRLADWPLNLAVLMGTATPGLVFWLAVCCAFKQPLQRLPRQGQWSFGVGFGALAGWLSHGFAMWMGLWAGGFEWPASAAGALIAAGLLVLLFARAKAQMPAATQARLIDLQSRIRPHFLFNALNSAMALVRDEPVRAEQVLEDLSELFRSALADSGAEVRLSEELALARSYLNIERTRFGERMQVEWALDDAANAARVPPLILQPLVENAVKHGVEQSPGCTVIKVSTQRRGGTVVIRVTNTVDASGASLSSPASPTRKGHGMALGNVRERLSLLHDVAASFRAMHKDGVYQVRIEVPISDAAA